MHFLDVVGRALGIPWFVIESDNRRQTSDEEEAEHHFQYSLIGDWIIHSALPFHPLMRSGSLSHDTRQGSAADYFTDTISMMTIRQLLMELNVPFADDAHTCHFGLRAG